MTEFLIQNITERTPCVDFGSRKAQVVTVQEKHNALVSYHRARLPTTPVGSFREIETIGPNGDRHTTRLTHTPGGVQVVTESGRQEYLAAPNPPLIAPRVTPFARSG